METGIYYGDTVWVLKNDFKKIYSIELSGVLFNYSEKRLKRYNNINLIKGDSREKIAEVLNKINNTCIF